MARRQMHFVAYSKTGPTARHMGETESIARERAEYLRSLIKPETWAARISGSLGVDVSKIDDEKGLARLQGNQGIRGAEDRIRER